MARDQTTADLAGIFKANMESLTAIQKELGDTFEEANRMDRAPHAAARRRQPEMRSRLSKIGECLDQGRGERRLEGYYMSRKRILTRATICVRTVSAT